MFAAPVQVVTTRILVVVMVLVPPPLAGALWKPDEAFTPPCDLNKQNADGSKTGSVAQSVDASATAAAQPHGVLDVDTRPAITRRRNVAELGLCRKTSPESPRAYDAGAPGDCFKLWWLTEHPLSPAPPRVSPSAEWLAGWCTPQRERRLHDSGNPLSCQELVDETKWNNAAQHVRHWFKTNVHPADKHPDGRDAAGRGIDAQSGANQPELLEPEFPFWTKGFYEVWQQHELATYLTPRSAECPWVVDALKFSCGPTRSCGEWYDRFLFKRRDIVGITVDPHDYLLLRDDAPLSPSIAYVVLPTPRLPDSLTIIH